MLEHTIKGLNQNLVPIPDLVITKWNSQNRKEARGKRGIYVLTVNYQRLYIGASYTDLAKRISRFFKPHNFYEIDLVTILANHFFSKNGFVVKTELYFADGVTPQELQNLEQLFITKLKPRMNCVNRKYNIKRLEQLQQEVKK